MAQSGNGLSSQHYDSGLSTGVGTFGIILILQRHQYQRSIGRFSDQTLTSYDVRCTQSNGMMLNCLG